MLMPCGPSTVPTGGAGVALPASSSIFSTARTFFFAICPLVHLFHLQQVQLHRGLAAEHVDEDLQLALLGGDLVDLAQEGPARPLDDPPALADLELDPDRGFLLDLLQDGLQL